LLEIGIPSFPSEMMYLTTGVTILILALLPWYTAGSWLVDTWSPYCSGWFIVVIYPTLRLCVLSYCRYDTGRDVPPFSLSLDLVSSTATRPLFRVTMAQYSCFCPSVHFFSSMLPISNLACILASANLQKEHNHIYPSSIVAFTDNTKKSVLFLVLS
jgi:hypothetical protein